MTISVTDADAILKEDYGPDGIGNAAYEDNPWFAMMPKHRFYGKHYNFPVKYGYGTNGSRTAATALGKINGVDYVEFEVPTVADYDAKSISLKALEEAQDEESFVNLLRDCVDSLVKSLSNTAGADAFLHRGAAIGQVGSISTVDVVLKDPSDVVHFEVGMEIASSEADGLSGALQAGTATITAIDRDTGTLTTDSNWTAQIATLDADDYLFRSGDFGIGRAGLADWIPDSTAGLGTAFYAATRSVDASRLAGSRETVTGLPVSQAIRKLATTMGREEGKADTALMSWATYNDLVTERDNKMEHVRTGSSGMGATVGFDGVRIYGGRGSIECFADRSCPDDHIYLVRKESWKCIHSQDQPVKVDDKDGNILSREASDFSYDVRGASFINFACLSPRDNGVAIYA